MRDKDLYATILGIQSPWLVSEVLLDAKERRVTVRINCAEAAEVHCPECGEACPRHDHRLRTWRHLDTCQYETFLEVAVPRTRCDEHGVHQIRVPWGEPGSRFTALFEALAIDWLLEASLSAVARVLHLSWDEIDGIQERAVRRGLLRRKPEELQRIGVDETSFQKRHEYVTSVCDLKRSRVLYVGDGRSLEALQGFFQGLLPEQIASIETVAMDMWRPYIRATLDHVPEASKKIAFDRFHVAQHLNEAVDHVRKREHRELRAQGDQTLARTKFLWLQNPESMTSERRKTFEVLRRSSLKVARAWALKDTARELWSYVSRTWATKAWKKWIAWARRSKLEPMQAAAKTISEHLWGIVNAIALRVTNATTESLNARIQWIKKTACGFRNRERFRRAILFHCGGLDLYPRPAPTHTKA